ncbi:DNA/RNA non-specific endonuclease [Vagococcus hydrophili]|uniref:DNA-entry nuclease n=1 Tax=Vagococcus hydrophili TaxID=2714947 RepID=A0A6G8AR96_9ENTE|nr:DNA/RNA non-specific endonuclease [Vagococcus hydrophili]QIL47510.1 DNA-entry nuclease [Vagococcus hydrophili]
MAKKKQHKQKHPASLLIGLIILLGLAFAGVQLPDFLNDFLLPGNTKPTSQKTTQAPSSQSGDNPGPIEHGDATFTQEEMKDNKKGWIHYGEYDQFDRPTTAEALITPAMIGTGTGAKQDIRPPGFISGTDPNNHSRGHLIGRQLGGSGEDPKNLVTLYQNPVNTPFMTKYENMVRKAADNGETIRYRVKPIYEGDIGMPTAVQMEGKGLNKHTKINFNVTIENKK